MQLLNFKENLIAQNIEVLENEPMKNHTTFKIGGNADLFVKVKSKSELTKTLELAKENEVPFLILGKGSNLLVSDNGIEGAVISVLGLNEISVNQNEISCGAGANLSEVCIKARDNGLTGLEFAYGIPGSVGGAVYMNAGAYGGEMANVLSFATCVFSDGTEKTFSLKEMQLGYRTSAFQKNNAIVTEVKLVLKKGEIKEISALMDDFLGRRKDKQPLNFPSAGSTFKRPQNSFAGMLIQRSGLMGKTIGGAMVSTKHAGFVVNSANASCKDVLELIDFVKKTVLKDSGISLEPEVIFVGRKM